MGGKQSRGFESPSRGGRFAGSQQDQCLKRLSVDKGGEPPRGSQGKRKEEGKKGGSREGGDHTEVRPTTGVSGGGRNGSTGEEKPLQARVRGGKKSGVRQRRRKCQARKDVRIV